MGQLGSTARPLWSMQCGNYVYAACAPQAIAGIWPIKYELAAFPSHFQPHTHTRIHTHIQTTSGKLQTLVNTQKQKESPKPKASRDVGRLHSVWHAAAVGLFPKVKFSIEFPLVPAAMPPPVAPTPRGLTCVPFLLTFPATTICNQTICRPEPQS